MTKKIHPMEERIAATIPHIVILLASIHFIISMMYYRQMPKTAFLFVLPTLLLLVIYWKRSPFVRDHAAQSAGWHGMLIVLGALPYLSRLPALVIDTWLKPAVHGEAAGFTPDFSLLTLLMIIFGFAFPAAAIDGVFQAAQRKVHQYPIVKRILPRPAFPDKDYIWTSSV